MDYQEVIKELKSLNKHCFDMIDKEDKDSVWIKDCEALSVAISAMQELQEYKQLGTLEEVREAVEKHKWIPCSERLPEMHREDMDAEGEYYMISNPVLVTDGQQIYIAEYEEDIGNIVGWHSLDGEDYENIIAWIPLPKPYNPERSNTWRK